MRYFYKSGRLNSLLDSGEVINVQISHRVFLILVLVLAAVLVVGYVYESEQTQRSNAVKSLVLDAASLIAVQGESAFAELRVNGSQWIHGDTYVFVTSTNGTRLVYPPDPSIEGQNTSTLVDYTGKPIGKMFIDIATGSEGEGWISYLWPKPGATDSSVKQAFIKGVVFGGESFLVGSGFWVDTSASALAPLQYVAVLLESVAAAFGVFLAVRRKRFFGWGIFLTFAIYVFYDLIRLIPLQVSNVVLYPLFFVATVSILWAVVLIYREKTTSNPA